jgi:hypothetical protein
MTYRTFNLRRLGRAPRTDAGSMSCGELASFRQKSKFRAVSV